MLSSFELATLTGVRHPSYTLFNEEWTKWRTTMAGGKLFLDTYLQKFSEREDDTDFQNRKALSYCAGYAKSAIKEIINAIFQRMRDITRVGGPDNYINAVAGRDGGVNREGMSMNMFMGQKILPELLSMGKVGIYVDMPQEVAGATLAETYQSRPYLYFYRVEDILNWNYTDQELRAVVLRDFVYTYDEASGMPNGTSCRYRYIWQDENDYVYVQTHEEYNDKKLGKNIPTNFQNYKLGLKRIPFIIADIGESLLTDIADHQVALTNLESSDVAYILKANFPLYTEQQNNKILPTHSKKTGENDGELVTGPLTGRQYPLGAERPGFIHPSPEPLKASMEKQIAIRDEIRNIVHLSVSNIVVSRASADSKAIDNEGLEAGLAFIGLTLEHVENYVAERWCEYVATSNIPTVKYPSQYSLQSDGDRRAAAKALFEMRDDLPTTMGRKELVKLAARTLFDGRVSPATWDNILDEIDQANYVSGRTEDIERDKKEGLVTAETASIARGYAKGEADKAKDEFFERLKLITETQSKGIGPNNVSAHNNDAMNNTDVTVRESSNNNPAARGMSDLSPNPAADAAAEKGGK